MSSTLPQPEPTPSYPTLLGHPAGLFTLFFAEMWERFSFYGMKAILILYMVKTLKYDDQDGYAHLGAYMALVYMMPFFGGILADRLLGQRRAVILGGLLMAAGQLLLFIPDKTARFTRLSIAVFGSPHWGPALTSWCFFTGLSLLICGNGFFKPNICTIVGTLYPRGSGRRDAGFTIFYMGINLGAAMAPVLCAWLGEKYGYEWGFGLAMLGILIGVAVFAAPTRVTQVLIAVGALGGAVAVPLCGHSEPLFLGANLFQAVALLIAGAVAVTALERGGIPADAGRPPDPARLRRPIFGPISAQWAVYLSLPVAVVAGALLVSGLAPLTADQHPMSLISEQWLTAANLGKGLTIVLREIFRPVGSALALGGLGAAAYMVVETCRMQRAARHRMYAIFVLMFFSIIFWSLNEQGGSSVNLFTDRNVDRVVAHRTITADQLGQTIEIQPTQKQLGYHNGDQLFTLDVLDALRKEAQEHNKKEDFTIPWHVAPDNVGMYIADRSREIPTAAMQEINPVFILIFGQLFTMLWTFLAARGREPSAPVKFSWGLLQTGLGFGLFWYGAYAADAQGMVALRWLVLGYLFQTTGELCLSPVGLSTYTRLAPVRLVSTVLGACYLTTGIAEFTASIIAQFTNVAEAGVAGAAAKIPAPIETVHVYGDLYGTLAIVAMVAGLFCLALAPLLKRWMDAEDEGVTR